MNKTYKIDDLYKVRDNFDNHEFDGFCITIDDFYENADEIYEHLTNRQYPMWKYNTESSTKNGVDYNDCRIVDTVGLRLDYYNEHNRILDLCRNTFTKVITIGRNS